VGRQILLVNFLKIDRVGNKKYRNSFYFNQQCTIYVFYFNNIYIIITSRCFDTFLSSSIQILLKHC